MIMKGGLYMFNRSLEDIERDYYKDRVVMSLDREYLFRLLEEWKQTVNPGDRAWLGALNFVQYLID